MIAEDILTLDVDALDIVHNVTSDVVNTLPNAESEAVERVNTVESNIVNPAATESAAVEHVHIADSNIVSPAATAKSDGVKPLSDASSILAPKVVDLPVVTTNDTPSTSGLGSSRRSPRRSSRRKPSTVTRKRRALDSYEEPEYALAMLSARKSC